MRVSSPLGRPALVQAGQVKARNKAGQGSAGHGSSLRDGARLGTRRGMARLVLSSHGKAWLGTWNGAARPVRARLVETRQGLEPVWSSRVGARRGKSGRGLELGKAWYGTSRHGMARKDMARNWAPPGTSPPGWAGRGKSGLGRARLGVSWEGRPPQAAPPRNVIGTARPPSSATQSTQLAFPPVAQSVRPLFLREGLFSSATHPSGLLSRRSLTEEGSCTNAN